MSFRFDFEVSSEDKSIPATTNGNLNALNGDDRSQNKANPFVVLENVSSMLQSRSKYKLDYDSVVLDDQEGTSVPLLRVCGSNKLMLEENGKEASASSDIVQELEKQKTDLLPGVYEGGMKVWECSVDLCQFLVKQWGGAEGEPCIPRGGFILELGCGHGLPGCLALRQALLRHCSKQTNQSEAFCVMFTDFNEFVLRDVTLSNIALNTREICSECDDVMEMVARHVILAGGDWMDLSHELQSGSSSQQQTTISSQEVPLPPDGRFDLILAAETTYTTKSAKGTATLMARHLALDTGVGLVATKRYYFGVGGGSDEFRNAAASERILVSSGEQELEYKLTVTTLQVYDSGVGNIRELLCVKLTSDL